MAFTTSPNMQLTIPNVGTEPGPQYAFDVNTALTLVDGHDHTPGKGVQITPAGLNINATLTFNDNMLSNVMAVVFQSQTSVSTAQALYVSPGTEPSPGPYADLWYNDGVNPAIQLTNNGTVNATIASIPGESYGGGTFTWRQGTGSSTPANFDIGSITIRPVIPSTTNGVTLTANSSGAYSILFPAALPAAQAFVTIDNSGNLTFGPPTANGITASNIANGTITSAQISPTAGITQGQLADAAFEETTDTVLSTGTYTVPAGVNVIDLELIGGGGGGGGGGSTAGTGGAGGGGGGGAATLFVYPRIAVNPGDVLTVTVGAAGTSGAAGLSGGNGGTTSIVIGSITFTSLGGGAGGFGGRGFSGFTAGGAGGNSYASGGIGGSTGGFGGGGGGGGGGYVAGAIGGTATNSTITTPTTPSTNTVPAYFVAGGGGGAGNGRSSSGANDGGTGGAPGTVSMITPIFTGGVGGTSSGVTSGSGGGGGGSAYASGGAGGNGNTSGVGGSISGTGYGAGGGGGGGALVNVTQSGGAGGTGGPGAIFISYQKGG